VADFGSAPAVIRTDPDTRKGMALREAERLFSQAEGQAWARRTRMLDWLMAWHGMVTMRHSTQRSQVGHDVTRESIERILPKLLGTDLTFKYFQRGRYQERTSKAADFFLRKRHYFINKLLQARDKCIYGRGYGKWRWCVESRDRARRLKPREIEAFASLGITKFPDRIRETVTSFRGPSFHAVDGFGITMDTTNDNPYRAAFIFEEFNATPVQILQYGESGLWDKAVCKAYVESEQRPLGAVETWRQQVIARLGIDLGTPRTFGKPVGLSLYEGYFPFDMDGDLKDEPCLLVSDPDFQAAFRYEENPSDHGLAPYTFDDWMRITGEAHPTGVAELLEPTQTMVNIWSNLAIDNIVLSVFPIWLKHVDAGIPGNLLRLIPNNMILTQINDGLKPLRAEDHTAQIHSWLQFYLKRAQELSGITAFSALGTPELGQTKTALGIQTLKAAAEEYLAFAKRVMLEESMDMDAQFMLELMQQYIDRDLEISILGEDGAPQSMVITPEDLEGSFTWQASVEQRNPLNRSLEKQAFEEWVAKALKMGVPLNILKVAMEMARMTDTEALQHPEQFLQMPPGMGMPGMGGPPGGDMGSMLMQAMQAAQAGDLDGGEGGANFSGGPQPAAGAMAMLAGEQ